MEKPSEVQPLEGLPSQVWQDPSLTWAIFVKKKGLRWNYPSRFAEIISGALLDALDCEVGTMFRSSREPEIRLASGEKWVVTVWDDLPLAEEDLRAADFICKTREPAFMLRLGNRPAMVTKGKGTWSIVPLVNLLNTTTPEGSQSHRLQAFSSSKDSSYRWEAVFHLVSRGPASTTAELWTRKVETSTPLAKPSV
jgi:hypothetical protein